MTAAFATDAPAEKSTDGKPTLLPFYLLGDVSGSMHMDIGALNTSLGEFRDELSRHPILSDVVRFGIVDFSDDARVVLPLTDPLESRMPTLSSRGGTSYGAAFRTMKSVIDADFDAARGASFKYFRPAVLFLTDGQPTDDATAWRAAFRDLTHYDAATRTGNKRYPLFVPFGFRDASAQILSELVHPVDRGRMYFAKQGASAAVVLQELAKAMLLSVVSSGQSAAAGMPTHVMPTQAQLGPNVTAYEGGDCPDDES